MLQHSCPKAVQVYIHLYFIGSFPVCDRSCIAYHSLQTKQLHCLVVIAPLSELSGRNQSQHAPHQNWLCVQRERERETERVNQASTSRRKPCSSSLVTLQPHRCQVPLRTLVSLVAFLHSLVHAFIHWCIHSCI